MYYESKIKALSVGSKLYKPKNRMQLEILVQRIKPLPDILSPFLSEKYFRFYLQLSPLNKCVNVKCIYFTKPPLYLLLYLSY